MMSRWEMKQRAGERAVLYVRQGMTVGLGTGSTVSYALQKLGERVEAGLKIRCIPTSRKTEELAHTLGLPLTDFWEADRLDLTIDGADELDPRCNLIKGGGGALLREKLVAASSREVIIVVDQSKLVEQLGTFPLPVEVVQFGWQVTLDRLAKLGCRADLRQADGEPFLTDNGNYIIDCHFEKLAEPARLEEEIDLIPGVVECGLFIGLVDRVLVGRGDGTVGEIICEKPQP